MPDPEKPTKRGVLATTLAFAVAIAVGWVAIYLAWQYLSTGWKM